MYKFIFEDEDHTDKWSDPYHTKRIEFQVRDGSSLDEMLDAFENFLKANGYHFVGNVDIGQGVDIDDNETTQPFKPFVYSNTYKDVKVTYGE